MRSGSATGGDTVGSSSISDRPRSRLGIIMAHDCGDGPIEDKDIIIYVIRVVIRESPSAAHPRHARSHAAHRTVWPPAFPDGPAVPTLRYPPLRPVLAAVQYSPCRTSKSSA